MAGTDVEPIQEAELVPDVGSDRQFLPANQVWENLDRVDKIEGFDLEQDKLALVGIPFLITKVVFREGDYARPGEAMKPDFVSVELVTAPPNFWTKVDRIRERYGLDKSYVGPNEEIVFNDSSTGVKRQLTWYLHSRGFITIDEDLPRDGETLAGSMGNSLYDYDPPSWTFGSEDGRKGIPVQLLAKRGLRFSDYENESTPNGRTFYLA